MGLAADRIECSDLRCSRFASCKFPRQIIISSRPVVTNHNFALALNDLGNFGLEKLDQRVRRFFGSLFQNPVTGVWQHDHGRVLRDELCLLAQFFA